MKTQEYLSLSEALLEALRTSSETLYRISEDSGLEYASLHRFRSGEQTLRLDMADRLAQHLGVTVRLPSRPRKGA